MITYNEIVESKNDKRTIAWVENWKIVGPQLERLKRETIRHTVTSSAIRSLDLAFKSAIKNTPPKTETGLVEFHRLLGKLPEK